MYIFCSQGSGFLTGTKYPDPVSDLEPSKKIWICNSPNNYLKIKFLLHPSPKVFFNIDSGTVRDLKVEYETALNNLKIKYYSGQSK
jgi:hypothetical protein